MITLTIKLPIILIRAVRGYGKAHQVMMAIEEMSELIKALCNESRGRPHNIAEEIADVFIMLHQLVIIFDNGTEVQDWIDRKIERLKERTGGG